MRREKLFIFITISWFLFHNYGQFGISGYSAYYIPQGNSSD